MKLKEQINASSLGPEGKEEWYNFVAQISDREAAPVLQCLRNVPNCLVFLTKNLIDKREAMTKIDRSLWAKVITEEVDFLKQYQD